MARVSDDEQDRWFEAWTAVTLRNARRAWEQREALLRHLDIVDPPSPRTAWCLGALWRAELVPEVGQAEAREADALTGKQLPSSPTVTPRAAALKGGVEETQTASAKREAAEATGGLMCRKRKRG